MWESVDGKLFGGDIRDKGGIWVNKSNLFFSWGRPERSDTNGWGMGWGNWSDRGCKLLFKLISKMPATTGWCRPDEDGHHDQGLEGFVEPAWSLVVVGVLSLTPCFLASLAFRLSQVSTRIHFSVSSSIVAGPIAWFKFPNYSLSSPVISLPPRFIAKGF